MRLTLKKVMAALETQGMTEKRLRALLAKAAATQPTKLSRGDVRQAESYLSKTGYCAMYRTSSGTVLFVHPKQFLPWPFAKRGGSRFGGAHKQHPRFNRVAGTPGRGIVAKVGSGYTDVNAA